ncbi:rna-directed dna polymerase from mobile element jockey [Lasius niger]|uniref:Rna-directed dna polymerase from mobile element jockey n=1 Tax=Lasius niger TaxID=67767 RepID=A0A0J7KKU0_LASNI|nr:rna-directed dna polymerase from mobile element jockey [Lasius niger]
MKRLGYKIYQKESIGNSGGIAICVRNSIEFDIIKEWQQIGNEFDVIGIRTKNTMERLNIIAIYRRPTGTVQRRKWKKLFEIDTRQTESLYVGDFNAHNTTWNCVQTDTNGERLWEITYNKDLICLNEDTMSRLDKVGQTSSNLDLVFASMNIADRRRWRITSRNLNNKNIEKNIRKEERRGQRRQVKWWDQECEEVIEQKKKALKEFKKNIEWTTWIKNDREEEIRKEIDKLAPPNVLENLRLNEEDITEEGHLNEEFSGEEMKRALEMIEETLNREETR